MFSFAQNISFAKDKYFAWLRWRTHKQGDIESDRWGGNGATRLGGKSGATRWGGGEGAKTNKAFEADQTPV